MKTQLTKIVVIFFVGVFGFASYANPNPNLDIEQLFNQMGKEIILVKKHYLEQKEIAWQKIHAINQNLLTETNTNKKVDLLIQKDVLNQHLQKLNAYEETNINKIRYLKGLSIIKILYEKVLSLDHHFSSVATFSEINKIANPNNYPEFLEVKDLIKNKTNKKKGLELTKILGNNIYTSSVDLILNLFNSEAKPNEKKEELKKIVELVI